MIIILLFEIPNWRTNLVTFAHSIIQTNNHVGISYKIYTPRTDAKHCFCRHVLIKLISRNAQREMKYVRQYKNVYSTIVPITVAFRRPAIEYTWAVSNKLHPGLIGNNVFLFFLVYWQCSTGEGYFVSLVFRCTNSNRLIDIRREYWDYAVGLMYRKNTLALFEN